MTLGIFTVSEERLTELEEMNSALQDQIFVLKRDLRQEREKVEELERKERTLRAELRRSESLMSWYRENASDHPALP